MDATPPTAESLRPTRGADARLGQKIALNSSAQAGRQLFTAVAGIVSVGVATRYLPVNEYGSVIAALVVISLFSLAGDFGISAVTARALAREPGDRDAIMSSAFWAWTLFTIPIALGTLVVTQVIYTGPEHALIRQSVLILLSTFVLGPLAGVATAEAVVEQRIWITSVGAIGARALSLTGVIVAAALDLGALGITAAFALGFVLEEAFTIGLVRPRIRLDAGLDRRRIGTTLGAAAPLGLIMVVNGLYFKLDAFMLSILGSTADVAVYGVAYKAFDLLIALPGFVMITLLPELARLEPDDPRFVSLVQKAFTGMSLVVVPLVGLSLLGREAMVVLGGHRYAEGGVVLTLIVLSVALGCLNGVFGNTLVAQGRQGVLLRVSLAALSVNAILNLAAIPLFGVHGAAVVLLSTELLSFVLTLAVYRRIAPLPRPHMPARMLAALAALMCGTCVRFAIPSELLGLLAAVAVGVAAYVAALAVLRALPGYVVEPVASLVRGLPPRPTR